jgi:hypothetical protein
MKTINIKLTKVGNEIALFDIKTSDGNIILSDVPRLNMLNGIAVNVPVSENAVIIVGKGKGCTNVEKLIKLKDIPLNRYTETVAKVITQSSAWRHHAESYKFNTFYGEVHPYIIEHPLVHKLLDEILSEVTDFTRVYRYSDQGIRIQDDLAYFNKSILYNDQQCSGVLVLKPKPVGNLKDLMSYPRFNSDSKEIIVTKSDNLYRYNTFWDIVKDINLPIFVQSCKSKSYDKELNKENLDYSVRSFKKSRMRGKYVKARHILDNRSDVNIISTIIIVTGQTSIK